jgi:hypothetical protein
MNAERNGRQDAQPPARLAMQLGTERFGVADVREDASATFVVLLAQLGEALTPRRTIQQPSTQPRLERPDVMANHRARQSELLGGRRETPAFHCPHENRHAFQSVQLRSVL